MPLVDLFGFGAEVTVEEIKDPQELLKSLAKNCKSCRLGQTTDRENNGFSYVGSTNAKVVVLGDMPMIEGTAMSIRRPMAGAAWDELMRWMRVLGLREDDFFLVNVIQCKTSKGKSKEVARDPSPDEIDICFPSRAMRVLKSLPNMEVLITLGWTAAAAVLSRDPKPGPKTHEGVWFGTDLLPGVAVFPLNHPREYDAECEPRKRGKLLQNLQFFQTEYLNPRTAKIRQVLEIREADRKSS